MFDPSSVCFSYAGLATARICHDHFERVIIVEPEAWLATVEGWKLEQKGEPTQKTKTRARVMQYQSLHGAAVSAISPHTPIMN